MPDVLDCDVLVVGGGTAGVSAAVTAARQGARVVLLERAPILGGNATAGMVGALCGLYAAGPQRRPVPGSVSWELIDRLRRQGACERKLSRDLTFVEHYDVARMITALDDLTVAADVDVRLHATMTGLQTAPQPLPGGGGVAMQSAPSVQSVPAVESVAVTQRARRLEVRPAQVIDASGDANVAAALGLPLDVEPPDRAQGGTLVFRMANVDIAVAAAQDRARWTQHLTGLVARGDYQLPKPTVAYWPTTRPGEVNCSMTSVAGLDLLGPDITAAEREGRRQAWEYERFLKAEVPGFEDAYLSHFGWTIGIRETRRVVGEYTVTADDLLEARSFADGLAYSAWPIEVHTEQQTVWRWLPEDRWGEIPHRAMLPVGTVNVQAIGRCLSATHEAHGSTRVMGAAMSMGEAAGLAAAMSADTGTALRSLDLARLRTELQRQRWVPDSD